MGIYDRDYERGHSYGESTGFHLGGSTTWTTKLVILMCVVYALQILFKSSGEIRGNDGWFTEWFSLHADVLRQPWLAFEFLTYGFLHDVDDFKHILFNGFVFWMFGRSVEHRYGGREYVTFFLAAIVSAGITWVAGELFAQGGLANATMLGASGGIAAVLLLFCLNFPHQRVYIWGVLPLPAWLFAILFVGMDVFGAVHPHESNVAFTAHLGGACFALAYFRAGWRLSGFLPSQWQWKLPKLRRRPPLRVHDPRKDVDDSTEDAVDNILRKIREQGQESLTHSERRILEEASREYQKKRR